MRKIIHIDIIASSINNPNWEYGIETNNYEILINYLIFKKKIHSVRFNPIDIRYDKLIDFKTLIRILNENLF